MIASIILLATLLAVGVPLWWLDRCNRPNDDEPAPPTSQELCNDDCCTTHEVCPSQELLASIDKAAVYYDDEHLDRFAGRAADGYTNDEIEEFRDVLYTLIDSDRMGWCVSLKKRGVVMPTPIHDEFLMLTTERFC